MGWRRRYGGKVEGGGMVQIDAYVVETVVGLGVGFPVRVVGILFVLFVFAV